MSVAQRLSADRDFWSPEFPDKLETAVEEYDLENTEDWGPLLDLSGRTELISVDVAPEASMQEDGRLYAPGSVTIELVYDPGPDEVSFLDSLPARIFFRVDEGIVRVTKIDVDTSAFYD